MAVNADVIEATTINDVGTVAAINMVNKKNLAELHGLTAGLSGQNQLANQQTATEFATANRNLTLEQARNHAGLLNTSAQDAAASWRPIHQALTARVTRFILDTSAEEAVSFAKQIQSDLSERVANLGASLSAVQEMVKIAQSTPPQTGTGGAFGSDAGSAYGQQLANISAQILQLRELVAKPA